LTANERGSRAVIWEGEVGTRFARICCCSCCGRRDKARRDGFMCLGSCNGESGDDAVVVDVVVKVVVVVAAEVGFGVVSVIEEAGVDVRVC